MGQDGRIKLFSWKHKWTGIIEPTANVEGSPDALFRITFGRWGTPEELADGYGEYVIVPVIRRDGILVEASAELETDRIWRLICEASGDKTVSGPAFGASKEE